MKFGKHIQKRQLDIPEYAASFVDYKALKKLIKKLSATPVILPRNDASHAPEALDPQASLQANKATFFFRLERELDKVNKFYLQKEAELKLRLTTLLDRKTVMQSRPAPPKVSSKFIAIEEGFRQFSSDLNKLQQFVEVNATAFSKILKKWDKTSKSRTKELYLSRAVEVQPCFNRDVITELSDQATTNLLDVSAWAEGENVHYASPRRDENAMIVDSVEADVDFDSQVAQSVALGKNSAIEDWTRRIRDLPDAQDRVTRVFLNALDEAPEDSLRILLDTKLVNLNQEDDINERNCLHVAAISGRGMIMGVGLQNGVDVRIIDSYGRIPLHYACIHGHVNMIQDFVAAAPDTIDFKDQNNYTPLLHAVEHSQLECVQKILSLGAQIDPTGDSDHIPLSMACQHSSQAIVELLLQKKPRILHDAEGLYPQHLVARSGKLPRVLIKLKDYGADLNQPDKMYQWTPLFHAASEGHKDCLDVLLQSHVDVEARDEKGLSAMYYATWEGHLGCIQLLASVSPPDLQSGRPQISPQILGAMPPPSSTPAPMSAEAEGIPDLSLPPPIIPVRRYGHNFLESKTFVVINFGRPGAKPVEFFDNRKYPAARLTVSSKATDLIPRNIHLPIQEDVRMISFQIDNLDSFTVDFELFPNFGSKLIAHAVALSRRFTGKSSSSGFCDLELFDPRSKVIGSISFTFQVVKPFHGMPLEITQFATYWKATSQFDSRPNALITGSSLSGEYVRVFVQLTSDGIPVLYPRWTIEHCGLDVAVSRLTYAEFVMVGRWQRENDGRAPYPLRQPLDNIVQIHEILASSHMTLRDALNILPPTVRIELHVLYPNRLEEDRLRLGPTQNINDFADSLLSVVFDHARELRESTNSYVRSVVFSSFNQDICTALNWKQPNFPVLLCNELGADLSLARNDKISAVQSSGRTTTSVKEAVQIAKDNNLMGMMCSSRLLKLAPALIDAIKTAGLVLVTDISHDAINPGKSKATIMGPPVGTPQSTRLPDGVDGFLSANGVLTFNETIDM